MLMEVAYFVLQLQTNRQIDRLTFLAYDFSFCCVKNGEELINIIGNRRTGISREGQYSDCLNKHFLCAEMLKINLRR